MKIYETVDDYLKNHKPGDIITFGGYGIMDGIKNVNSKHDIHKVHKNTTEDKIVVREYRGRRNLTLGANSYDQQVGVLTPSEFKALPVLW